jgi:hypothetical protein
MIVGVVSCLWSGVAGGQTGGKAHHHEFKGEVIHVDHKHHTFTVRVHHGVTNGKHHHTEHKFHTNGHTKFDVIGGGKGPHTVSFGALHHGEHVVVHVAHGESHHATRVDIHKRHHATSTKTTVNKQLVRK